MEYVELTPTELAARYDKMHTTGRSNGVNQRWSLWRDWGDALQRRTLVAATLTPSQDIRCLCEELDRRMQGCVVLAMREYPLHVTIAQADGYQRGFCIPAPVLQPLSHLPLRFDRVIIDGGGTVLLCGTVIPWQLQLARHAIWTASAESGLDPTPTPSIMHVSLARPREGFDYDMHREPVQHLVEWFDYCFRRSPQTVSIAQVQVMRTIDFLQQRLE